MAWAEALDHEVKPTRVRVFAQRVGRRLTDKILVAFHQACDQHEHDVGAELLRVLESLLERPDDKDDVRRTRAFELLIAAHERLWLLRHPERFNG